MGSGDVMNRKKKRRLAFVGALVLTAGAITGLSLYALRGNVRYFYSPSDLKTEHVASDVAIRIGGLVQAKSFRRGGGTDVKFLVTDGANTLPVTYSGVLPALFREGQGVVATGALRADGTFIASEVLAKHDEKYTPPEVTDALRRAAHPAARQPAG